MLALFSWLNWDSENSVQAGQEGDALKGSVLTSEKLTITCCITRIACYFCGYVS